MKSRSETTFARSANMRAIKSINTKPEIAVRGLTHKLGYRFRLHGKQLPGKPDMVFASRHAVIFIHGCFWHQHNSKNCKYGHRPKSNLGYWEPKLTRNKRRDAKSKAELKSQGWKVLTIWECEVKKKTLTHKIKRFLDNA